MALVQSNCRLKWKREKAVNSLTPKIQSRPFSCPGRKDCRQSEAIHIADVMAELAQEFLPLQADPSRAPSTGARAGTRALHSSGPFPHQPEVISEAQPGTAPTVQLRDKGDYRQSSLNQICSELKVQVQS